MKKEWTIKNLKEMDLFAKSFQEKFLSEKENDHATLVALYGDLGSGKTTFVRSLAAALGITSRVTSPTFVIERRYKLPHSVFKKLIHIDAYRLENDKNAEALLFEETYFDPTNLICLEWPENISGFSDNADHAL
jgi:tRNA threonylcarbamoyladenosine biosynthesis protein TsaE